MPIYPPYPHNPSAGTFAHELRRLRGDMSQHDLAYYAGYDHSYISRLEAGRRKPTWEAVRLLADALGCDDEHRDRLLVLAGYLPLDHHLTEIIWRYLNLRQPTESEAA